MRTATTAALADAIGMSERSVRLYAQAGRIPFSTTPGGHRRFDIDEVRAALQSVRGLGEPQTLDRLRRLRRQIEACASRHGAHDVRVFGSVAAGTAGSASDVDLLVRLDHGRTYSDIDALENELSELLGVDVDVLTEGACRGRLAAVIHQAVAL